jgi:hypothetical protein
MHGAVQQELHQLDKFVVLLVMFKGNDWDSVAQLEPKAKDSIID